MLNLKSQAAEIKDVLFFHLIEDEISLSSTFNLAVRITPWVSLGGTHYAHDWATSPSNYKEENPNTIFQQLDKLEPRTAYGLSPKQGVCHPTRAPK